MKSYSVIWDDTGGLTSEFISEPLCHYYLNGSNMHKYSTVYRLL